MIQNPFVYFEPVKVSDKSSQYLDGNPFQFSKSEIQLCYKMNQGYPLIVKNFFSTMYEEKTK